ncbi:AraC family transcriptional regulator [Gammaproteobacteria bacterium]|nr:AraC family transcriptional regulator [Gammaproteobacteria bacterium]
MPDQTQSNSAPEVMVRIGPLMGVPAALEGLGFDPQEVLIDCGFDIGLFDDPDNLISFSARGRLMARCAAKTNCHNFGLLVGQHSGLRSLGLVGLLAQHSPDVRTALENLVRYFHLQTRGSMLTLHENSGIVTLNYHIKHFKSPANAEVGAGAVAILFNILRELCGPHWLPREAWFIHPQPINTEAYRRFFQTHLRFNAEQNAIFFLASWLNLPLKEAHPDLYKLAKQQIDSLETRQADSFPEQVRELLPEAILRGDCNADHIAALFSMHPRTLNRHLKDYGIGFQKLRDEVSYTMATQLLNETDLEVSQISTNLNYADARSFIRAFRRWSGTTPARWRKARKRHY